MTEAELSLAMHAVFAMTEEEFVRFCRGESVNGLRRDELLPNLVQPAMKPPPR